MVTRVNLTNPPNTVLAGNNTTFTCVTSASKPQACIRAFIQSSGNVRELDKRACNQDSSTIQTTTRTLMFRASDKENRAKLYCNASNSVTDPPVQSQVYPLTVHYPPQDGVSLSGYVNNTAVESGETLNLTCQVREGNPRPTLTWSSECGQTNTVSGNDGREQINISITVSPSLNQKTCVCQGSQDGALTGWREHKTIICNVTFGPDRVQLRVDSRTSGNTVNVTENSTVTFTCNTSESNPGAVLTWYNNSSPMTAADMSDVSSHQGHNQGYLTTQRYTVRVNRYQDGDVISCEAQRPGNRGRKRASPNLTLDVKYGPMFTSCKSSYIFVENVTAELSCTTWAKPEPTISWSRGGQSNDLSMTNHRYTSVVRFGKINRTVSGAYIVTASNNVKRVERTVSVSVYYPPNVSVVLVSGENVTEGNPLQLECRAEAVPQNYTYSAWSRTIGDRPVPLINSSPGKSLSISEVTFRDQGIYRCGATNGFGGIKRGQLGLRVRAYVNLTWYKLSSNTTNTTSERLVVSNTTGSKFHSHVMEAEHEFQFNDTKVLLSGHVAELEVSDVKRDDFGEYKFVAENDVGSSETIMSFNLIDRPCPPNLTTILCENRVANVTWISCFNGGSSQIFKLQYKKKGGNWVIHDDITDPGENMTVSEVVESLDDGAQYSFRVYGQNRWNKSDTVETSCTVTVSTVPPGALTGPLAGGISGAIILMGVVLLVVVIIRRRKQGNDKAIPQEKLSDESPANEHETTASVGHAGAYEDVDLIPSSSPSGSDVPAGLYAVVDKKKGPPVYAEVNKPETAPKPTKEQAAPVYAEVNKPRKTGEAAKAPEGPVYAEVNKTQKKANEEKGKKPTPADKTGLINGKKKDGNGQSSANTFDNAAFTGDEVMYSNSGEVERTEPSARPGQMEGPHDLIYADMDFVGTQPIVHPAENTTTYASIAFGQVGPPVVYDNDEEDGHPNSS
ncbi:hemicentin-2-like [Liolophura sinensis]|uniref:hemicentin-2-like n=1 Tax=Liolophura sinensis TaxID=3198878 RepID=UPI003158B472